MPRPSSSASSRAAQADAAAAAAPPSLGENLGKRLTHVDAVVRERTVKALEAWMRDREKEVGDIDEVEMMQLWKGLHHTLWMTDKVPVQLQMSEALSCLSRSFRRPKNVHGFFTAFFAILRREWTSIDYLRLDKYLSLVRRMVHEWFVHLEKAKWSQRSLDDFVLHVRDEVIMPTQPDGLRMHVAFVYLTELHRVGGALLDGNVVNELLAPFYCVLVSSPSEVMFKSTVDDVFISLVDRFGPLPADSNDSEAVLERFQKLNKEKIGQALYEIASSTKELTTSHRKQIYSLAKRFGYSAVPKAAPTGAAPVAVVVSAPKVSAPAAIASKEVPKESPAPQKEEKRGTQARTGAAALEKIGKTVTRPLAENPKEQPLSATKESKAVKFTVAPKTAAPESDRKRLKKQVPEPAPAQSAEPLFATRGVMHAKGEGNAAAADDDLDVEPASNQRRVSGASASSVKSVRFSHMDVVGINRINRQMKATPSKSAASMGMPTKKILKKPGSGASSGSASKSSGAKKGR